MSDLNADLIELAGKGTMEECLRLIDRGANINATGGTGVTPLLKAALWGEFSTCQMLIERGANPNATTSGGETPLMWAAPSASGTEICRLLLENGADVNATSKTGWSALLSACTAGKVDLCRLLVKHGASLYQMASSSDADYLTPFQQAVKHGRAAVVQFFVAECGEDLAQRTISGATMIKLAGKHREVKSVLRSAKTHRAVADSLNEAEGGASAQLARMSPRGPASL